MSNVRFKQSLNDFPLMVSLDKKNPSWGLSRFGGGCDLRFVPVAGSAEGDDERLTLRGDRQQVLYKGQKRSHRFTILHDGAFEYDCILLREPESNVIALRMEGAERFDFFRQPDFVLNDFLKGSYAVYKKETLVGEGTGKLCHIHRPKIIDARGMWCWGDLAVVGNELRIIIPETFLSEAKYPVVVDPTVGTTTIGSQTLWDYDPPEPPIQLYFEGQIPVNRFLVPETINGLCTAYMYSHIDNYGEAGGRPVLYSDNGNKPLARKSMNETFTDFTVNGSKKAGWRSATFQSNGAIQSGSYVWFGVFAEYYWEPRFDYGSRCYKDWHDGDIPNTYPASNYYEDFKISMYFTYTSAQNYVRTLTQGVKLTDSRKLTASYKREAKQSVKVNSLIQRFESMYRKCVMTVRNAMSINRLPVFYRSVVECVQIDSIYSAVRSLLRRCVESIQVQSMMKCLQGFVRSIQENVRSGDIQSFPVLIIRNVKDEIIVFESTRHTAEYIKTLEERADVADENKHSAEYHRVNVESVQADGTVFRGLFLFVKIITKLFTRDYIIHRFLKAHEELKLKSCISREITLNSKII